LTTKEFKIGRYKKQKNQHLIEEFIMDKQEVIRQLYN